MSGDGFESGIERILSSPEAMARIAQIAQGLGAPAPSGPPEDAPVSGGNAGEAAERFAEAAAGLSGGDRRVALLKAMQPFAEGKSAETVRRAIFAVRVAKAVRAMMPPAAG